MWHSPVNTNSNPCYIASNSKGKFEQLYFLKLCEGSKEAIKEADVYISKCILKNPFDLLGILRMFAIS